MSFPHGEERGGIEDTVVRAKAGTHTPEIFN
jgi:hypothetical protein